MMMAYYLDLIWCWSMAGPSCTEIHCEPHSDQYCMYTCTCKSDESLSKAHHTKVTVEKYHHISLWLEAMNSHILRILCLCSLSAVATWSSYSARHVHLVAGAEGVYTSPPGTTWQRVSGCTPRRRGGWSLRTGGCSWWRNTFRMW